MTKLKSFVYSKSMGVLCKRKIILYQMGNCHHFTDEPIIEY